MIRRYSVEVRAGRKVGRVTVEAGGPATAAKRAARALGVRSGRATTKTGDRVRVYKLAAVGVDEWGRVRGGRVTRWAGVHVADLAIYERRRRRILLLDCAEASRAAVRRLLRGSGFALRYKTIDEAIDFVEDQNGIDFGAVDVGAADIQDLSDTLQDGRGRRLKVVSLRDAFRYAIRVANSNRARGDRYFWADLPKDLAPVVAALRAAGVRFSVTVPDVIAEVDAQSDFWEDCAGVKDAELSALDDAATGGRLRLVLEAAPF
jgi:hypothetical protein